MSAWADILGYSPSVRRGPLVVISGTGSVDEQGNVLHLGDSAGQARLCLERIAGRLREAGASVSDVVSTRVYLAHGADWEAVASCHGDVFRNTRPACTMIRAELLDPAFLVEIEALAWISSDNDHQP